MNIDNDARAKLPEIYGNEFVKVSCFNCAGVWDSNWFMENELTNNISDNPKNLPYFLTLEKREYYLNTHENAAEKIELSLDYYSYSQPIKMIRIKNTNSTFFYDSRYMKPERIYIPKKYLKTK